MTDEASRGHVPGHDEDAAYRAEEQQRTRRGASAYGLIAVFLLLATSPLDRVRFPEVASLLLGIRIAGAAVLALLVALLQTGVGGRHPRILGVIVATVLGVTQHALAFFTGGVTSPVNVGTNFAVVGIGVLIPWPPVWSALASGLVLAGYVATALVHDGTVLSLPALDQGLLFAAGGALCVVLTVARQRLRHQQFAQAWALGVAHREVRDREKRYRSLVETAGVAIVILSPAGRITELNREAERVFGWRREDVVGRDVDELWAGETVGPDIAKAIGEEPLRDVEVKVRTPDGHDRVVVCNASRLIDDEGRPTATILCAQDVSERKRAQEALRESEERLRTVIDSAPIVLFVADRNWRITISRGRGLGRLGLAPNESVGKRVVGLDAVPEATRNFERAFAGEEVAWVGSRAGATFECRLTPLRDGSGAVVGIIGVAIDITERREAEDARLLLERRLLEAQKAESLALLAGGVAHDFNNLLACVLGGASLVAAELPPESPARQPLGQIEKAARRGSDLTRQMLAYAGKGAVTLEPVDLNAVVEEMRDILRVSLGPRVTVRCELAPRLPLVEADPVQARQVVMNLMINAAEAMGGLDGTITARTGRMMLDEAAVRAAHHGPETAPGAHVFVEVADTGCGMDASTLGRIFDPFFSTKLAGRGLGLAAVLGIVRGHRGALAVESAPGRGTSFRVLLPCGDVEAVPTVHPPASAGANGRTILLVDDEEDVRVVTAHMLERLGWSVLMARDGHEGVEVFRRHAGSIDAVILDIALPRLRGDRAFHAIRGIRPDARVILMSGYNDEQATRPLADAGLAGFLQKPFSVADLRATMDRVLANGTRAGA